MSYWKDYNNPLYDDVNDPERWLNGYCCIFANALQERFGLPMQALVVESAHDGDQTLIHAFVSLPDGRKADAEGVKTESQLLESYAHFTEKDWRMISCNSSGDSLKAGIKIHIIDVTLDDLWDLNPEDHEATNAAHRYIDENPSLFTELNQNKLKHKRIY